MNIFKNIKLIAIIGLFVLWLHTDSAAKSYTLLSPDKRINIGITIGAEIHYSVTFDRIQVITPSKIALSLTDNVIWGEKETIKSVQRRTVNDKIFPVVKEKSAVIIDHYNELRIDFKKPFSLIFRAYNQGVAYRWVTRSNESITIVDEEVNFRFDRNHHLYFPEEESFMTHQERTYQYLTLGEIRPNRKCSIPVLVEMANGPWVLITESDLEDYPGLYLTGKNDAATTLKGIFPHFALAEKRKNDRDIVVTEYADFMVRTNGKRELPWRVLIIAATDDDLIQSQLVYQLARPLQLKDASWIKPGKVAWDWWDANNLYGVDFKAGVNTATYKYYIDFAAQYRLEYVILDEGWYQLGDLFAINPDVDLQELLRYAREKNVGIILWVVWKTLEDQLEPALAQFEKWGVQGIKVDFMQRDDPEVVNYYWKIAAKAAEHKLLVDFHGAHKPTGLRRAYPNVITREGVLGLEHNKWSTNASPEHAVTLPFIRMVAGPMDYTPGAMLNATQNDFRTIFNRPMSQGTRCHQLALYVVFESPLQMLADSPSNYLREPECLDFLALVPTVWDETRVLAAKVADYLLLARKSGDEWYLGAITDWTARDLEVDFSFLGVGAYGLDSFQDGVNADRCAQDYRRNQRQITATEKMSIHLAPGGGWVARIYRQK